MCLSKLIFRMGAAVISSVLLVTPALAAHDPRKVLTADAFSKVMGYAATINTTASTRMSCFYSGPEKSGGQFTILTESAAGPQAVAMLNRRGSTPPPGSG